MQQHKSRLFTFMRLVWLRVTDPQAAHCIAQVKRKNLTFLSKAALLDLYAAAREIERSQIPGIFVEAGCALGGSALVLATAKSPERPFFVYDTFEMIPPPSRKDGPDAHRRYAEILAGQAKGPGNTCYYGYQGDILPHVRRIFVEFGFDVQKEYIYFIKGLFQERLDIQQPVALAHIDSDWYDSVMVCLKRIVPHLSPGGRLIVDDYESWSGCQRAVDEFFADKNEFVFEMKSRLHIRRLPLRDHNSK